MAAKKKSPTKKKPGAQCNCIEEMNKALQRDVSLNLQLKVGLSITMGTICVIPTEKRDSFIRIPPGQNVKHVQASYCPFCGKKYIFA